MSDTSGSRTLHASRDVTVSFDAQVCQHAAECVRGLPSVFDITRQPWIDPNGASAADVVAQVARCPSGALRVESGP